MNFLTQIFNITSSRHQNTSKPSMTGIAHMRAALPKVEKEIRTYKNPSSISLDIDKHKNIVIVIYYYHQAGFGIDIGDFIEMGMSWRQCLAAVILAVVCGGGYLGLWFGLGMDPNLAMYLVPH